MDVVDYKFCGILSLRLDQFKVKKQNPYAANFRCPICGDSQISKTKARGWLLEKQNKVFYYCHNCSASMSLDYYLKKYEPSLHGEYVIDKNLEKYGPRHVDDTKPPVIKGPTFPKQKKNPLDNLEKCSDLDKAHIVRRYLSNRMIPDSALDRLYYAESFPKWVNSIIPNKLKLWTDPRIVIPFMNDEGDMFGFTGRALNPKAMRYITIMLDDTPKVYGLDRIDFEKPYYIVEGAFDSLFVPNCLAMAGGDSHTEVLQNPENAIFCYDNEPRNKDVVSRMMKAAKDGYKVVVWPDYIHHKDINDMVLSGLDPVTIMEHNTVHGLNAELKITTWSKV